MRYSNHFASFRVEGAEAIVSGRLAMRVLPLLIIAFTGVGLCANAVAQDRDGAPSPRPPAPAAATTGAAPRGPQLQAPIGHRQPTAAAVPHNDGSGDAVVSPYDQEIDRNLNICRGC